MPRHFNNVQKICVWNKADARQHESMDSKGLVNSSIAGNIAALGSQKFKLKGRVHVHDLPKRVPLGHIRDELRWL